MLKKNRDLVILHILVFAVFTILLVKLYLLQIKAGDRYDLIATKNFVRIQKTLPLRGEIYDRNYRSIVLNKASIGLYLIPGKLKNKNDVIQMIETEFGVNKESINELLYRNRFNAYREIPIVNNVDYQKFAEISEHLDLYQGVFFKTEHTRQYMYDNHFTGYIRTINEEELIELESKSYTSDMKIGKMGIEKQYEEILQGKPGYRILQVNATGKSLELFRHNLDKPAEN
ncbi:MAG: penicillin-binding protein 2, partial [Candidatus Cloacimonetes bacterium]|nr:penicillin-binding protein 2 [Candidatus Cloacimonadota bacterium]